MRRSGYARLVTTAPHPPALHPPRGLVLGASAWIAISWLALVGPRPPLQPTSLSYTPAIRMMVQSMLVLTIVAWPVVRLSTTARPRPVLSAALDTIAMLVLWQIVLWPMRLVTTWPVGRVLTLDAEAIAACVGVGAVVAWCPVRPTTRTLGMAVILAWVAGVPGLVSLLGDRLPSALAGPLVRTWIESGLGPGPVDPASATPAIATLAIAIVAWIATVRRRPSGAGGMTLPAVR